MTMTNVFNCFAGAIALIATLACVAAPAQATLLTGQTVRLEHSFPTVDANIGSVDAVVGEGSEWATGFAGIYSVDVSDTMLSITFLNNRGTWTTSTAFNGLQLVDINNTIAAFTSATLVSSNFGFSQSFVTFDANNIYVNFGAYGSTPAGGTINIAIGGADVPEPASIALIGFGLLGLAMARRKQA